MHHLSDRPNIDLGELARRAMIDRGLQPDFSSAARAKVAGLQGPATTADESVRDLRHLLWASIDNDDSRDLDQLTVAEDLDSGDVRILVAIADVDALVQRGDPVDTHARWNTTSVYTAVRIFPMLPERLSTDLTSLNEDEDRLAIVVAYVVRPDGSLGESEIYRGLVRNRAKLAYRSVAAWMSADGEMPEPMARVAGVDAQIRLQDRVAHLLRKRRYEHGALELLTIETRAVVQDGQVVGLELEEKNRAHELIEDLMIAANEVTARYLDREGSASLRRVVRSPRRWDRIVELASRFDEHLPDEPDSRALGAFLDRRRQADPLRFPDLSLSVVKLLGAGEYVMQRSGAASSDHFGLAVRNYAHSTAPNRRFPDIITQRLLKATLRGDRAPYGDDELEDLAAHCTAQEDAANKVERQVRKSAAAFVLARRVGERFEAIVTGAAPKGTWVRTLHPPVEGRLVGGFDGVDVGDRIDVRLVDVDVERGFIDFNRADH